MASGKEVWLGCAWADAGFSAHQRQTTHEAALSCQMEVASG